MSEKLIQLAVTIAITVLLLVLALYGMVGIEHLVAKYLGLGIEHIIGGLFLIMTIVTIKNEL